MNVKALENRVVELETRVAFQEQAISEMSDVIVAQQTALDQIGQKMQRLAGRVASFEEMREEGTMPEPPPPHY
jgi:SlyX protein